MQKPSEVQWSLTHLRTTAGIRAIPFGSRKSMFSPQGSTTSEPATCTVQLRSINRCLHEAEPGPPTTRTARLGRCTLLSPPKESRFVYSQPGRRALLDFSPRQGKESFSFIHFQLVDLIGAFEAQPRLSLLPDTCCMTFCSSGHLPMLIASGTCVR